MSNPQEQYNNLFGQSAAFAEHQVGDMVTVPGAGNVEIIHITAATEDQPMQYICYDGVDFPFPVDASQVRELK